MQIVGGRITVASWPRRPWVGSRSAGEGGMGKAILSRVCRSITEVRASAEAAGNGGWHWGWGLWPLG